MQPTCLRVIFHLLSTMDIPVPSLKLTVHPWKLAKTPKWSRIVGSSPFPIQFQVLLLMEKIMHQLIRVRRASRKPGPGEGPSPDRTGTETGSDISDSYLLGARQDWTFLGVGQLHLTEFFWWLGQKHALVFQPQKKTNACHCCCFGIKTMVDSMACRKPCTSIGLGGLEISNLQLYSNPKEVLLFRG